MHKVKGRATAFGSLVVLVVLTVGAAVLGVAGAPESPGRTASVTPENRPWVPLPVTSPPTGWVPVAFGSLQISVPATWRVVQAGASACGTPPPGVVLSDWNARAQWCPPGMGTTSPLTTIVVLSRTDRLIEAPRRSSVVHGIALTEGLASVTPGTRDEPMSTPNGEGAYLALRQDIEVTISGPPAPNVLQTLGYSARANAMASGSGPGVSASWRRVSYDGMRFAAPPTWPIEHLTTAPPCTNDVSMNWQRQPSVTIATGRPLPTSCPLPIADIEPVEPVNGIEVDAWNGSYRGGSQCAPRQQAGLRMCLDESSPGSILYVKVTEPSGKTFGVQIGLGGDGRIARTLLRSFVA